MMKLSQSYANVSAILDTRIVMRANQLIRSLLILVVALMAACTAGLRGNNVVSNEDMQLQLRSYDSAKKPLTIQRILELAIDQDRDGVAEIAAQLSDIYSDVPREQFDSPYGVEIDKTLADGAVIENALLSSMGDGPVPGFTLRLSKEQCYPLSKVVPLVYADGPLLGDYYERRTLWVHIYLGGDERRKCMSYMYVGRPSNAKPLFKDFFPIPHDRRAVSGTMDEIFRLLAGDDAMGIGRIKEIVGAGYALHDLGVKSPSKYLISQLDDGYFVDYAHQYSPQGSIFAIEMMLSDKPCFSLARAVQITDANEEKIWPEDVTPYVSRKSHNVRIFPHARSAECVGWVTAFYGK